MELNIFQMIVAHGPIVAMDETNGLLVTASASTLTIWEGDEKSGFISRDDIFLHKIGVTDFNLFKLQEAAQKFIEEYTI